MRITVITGSGRKFGTSAYLADEFIKGAKAAGNEVFRFDAAFEDMRPCNGCGVCRKNGKCIQGGAFEKLVPEILVADMIVWTTPVYYMTMTAQLKMVVDRMYQLEKDSRFKEKKSYILLATAWDSNPNVFNILTETFEAFCRFLRWEKAGEILACGMDTRTDIESSNYGKLAYNLGYRQR